MRENKKKQIFRAFFRLFMASVRSRPPGPPAVLEYCNHFGTPLPLLRGLRNILMFPKQILECALVLVLVTPVTPFPCTVHVCISHTAGTVGYVTQHRSAHQVLIGRVNKIKTKTTNISTKEKSNIPEFFCERTEN